MRSIRQTGVWMAMGTIGLLCMACGSESSALCGNGILEPGEGCDGLQLNGYTCTALGYPAGQLSCNPNCTFNVSACGSSSANCGNNRIDPDEDCESGNLNSQTCASLGYSGGELKCTACSYDTSSCTGCTQDVYEPNDTSGQAQDISFPFNQSGLTLCYENENDWYQLNLTEGQRIQISLNFTNASGNIDALLYKNPELGTPVVYGTSSSDDEVLNYTVPAGQGGLYLILVELMWGDSQSYSLQVSQSQLQGDSCQQPIVVNSFPFTHSPVDIAQFSNSLYFSDTSCGGSQETGKDIIFQFTLNLGQKLVADLTENTFDATVYLTNQCSTPPLSSASCLAAVDASGDNAPEHLEFMATSTGTYYLVIDYPSENLPTFGTGKLDLAIQYP